MNLHFYRLTEWLVSSIEQLFIELLVGSHAIISSRLYLPHFSHIQYQLHLWVEYLKTFTTVSRKATSLLPVVIIWFSMPPPPTIFLVCPPSTTAIFYIIIYGYHSDIIMLSPHHPLPFALPSSHLQIFCIYQSDSS